MSTLDIIILIVAVGAILTGLQRGAIRQLGSIVGFVAAIVACRLFGDVLAPMFTPDSLKETALGEYAGKIIGGSVIYILIYIVVGILARGLRLIAKTLMLGPIDRLGGAVVALLKWGVALSVVLNLWLALFPSSRVVRESTLCGGKAVEAVMELAPGLWGVATHAVFDSDNQSEECDVVEEKTQQ